MPMSKREKEGLRNCLIAYVVCFVVVVLLFMLAA